MNCLPRVLIASAIAIASLRCGGIACPQTNVRAKLDAAPGRLTWADLLAPGPCAGLRLAAEQVDLGTAPRPGSVRVFDGQQIRHLLEGLAPTGNHGTKESLRIKVPAQIVVKRAGARMSCAEIANFLASAMSSPATHSSWRERMECAAAPNVPADTPIELAKTVWNPSLQRREFTLRCVRPQDCVPFLLWVHEAKPPSGPSGNSSGKTDTMLFSSPQNPSAKGAGRLVLPGQTAILTWDGAGIRIVLPVICLDAGGLGEFVRVRFKNAPGVLRAEVVGNGTLRANL